MEIQYIVPPERLKNIIPKVEKLSLIGDPQLLAKTEFALFCSVKCPASIILKTYDFAQKLKNKAIGIISGFHSPVEKEVLVTLLRGDTPVIICPARSIEKMRVPTDWRLGIEQGRMLILSPFPETQNRATEHTSAIRNQLIATLAQQIFIAYAEPTGKTEAFALALIPTGKSVITFNTQTSENLLSAGAIALDL